MIKKSYYGIKTYMKPVNENRFSRQIKV